MDNTFLKIIFSIILFVQPCHIYTQSTPKKVQFPNCSKIENIDFDLKKILHKDIRFSYVRAKDTLESMYCFAKKINNPELEAISLYKLGLEYQEEEGNLFSFRQMIGYIEKSMEISRKHNFHEHLLTANEILCSSFTSNKVYGQAQLYANDFLDIALQIKDSIKIAEGYMLLGRIFREQEEYFRSDSILNLSLNYASDNSESYRVRAYTYLHLSNLRRLEKRFAESVKYGELGLEMADKTVNHKGFLYAILSIEIILSKIEIGESDNEQFLPYIENYAKETKSKWIDGQLHFIKGRLYESAQKIDEAIKEYTIALENSFDAGTRLHTLKSSNQLIPLLLSQKGNEEKVKRAYHITQETFNEIQKHNGSDNLFKVTYYRLQSEINNSKFLEGSLANYHRMLLFAFCAISLLILLGISLHRQNQSKKRYNEKLNELNSKLNSNNLRLVESNKIINEKKEELQIELKHQLLTVSSFTDQMNKLEKTLKSNDELTFSSKKKILSVLNFERNSKIIDDINLKFLEVNDSFISGLSNRFPNLTNNELKLCLYLKMNMSTKEIAQIQYKSPNSVKVARSRLRKKLGIEDTAFKLSIFLNSINSGNAEIST